MVVGAGLAACVLAGCNDPYYHPSSDELLRGMSPSSDASGAPANVQASPAAVTPTVTSPAGQRTAVIRVIDGDTFEVTGGDRIRVLGIDSCEAGTDGGRRATADARSELSGESVTLTSEPGVNRDRYGRELRYVATSFGDFGEFMVARDHTAVYAGHNDASPSYLAQLRALDGNGRTCDDPDPVIAPAPVTDSDGSADAGSGGYVAAPTPSTASSGPAYYQNCSAARAAGAAPLYVGQPGYSRKLDRDGDGVACE